MTGKVSMNTFGKILVVGALLACSPVPDPSPLLVHCEDWTTSNAVRLDTQSPASLRSQISASFETVSSCPSFLDR